MRNRCFDNDPASAYLLDAQVDPARPKNREPRGYMSLRSSHSNHPFGHPPIPRSFYAIQPETRTGADTGPFTVVPVLQGEVLEARAGLGLEEIRDMARDRAEGAFLVACGPSAELAEGLWQIAAGLDSFVLDVRALAQILLPGLKDYEPATVAACFDADQPRGQDAADTGRMTAWNCLKLSGLLSDLDADVLATLVRLSEGGGTGLERVLAETLSASATTERTEPDAGDIRRNLPFDPGTHSIGDGSCDPGEESEAPDPLDVDELAGLFEEGGLFESRMEGFEQRPQQVSMVRGIARAFNDGEVFVVEAGTGTGKSLSYLTPALLWAARNGLRVIVSTNTRNLQEQLFYKDLPFLLDNLGVPFSATLLKGRSNYLCLDRWRQVIRRPEDHLTPEEREAAIPLVVWARETNTGDVAEHAGFNTGANRGLWEKINGEGSACPRCAVKDACFVNRARAAALTSHVVIVNHALLFSDLEADHAVLSRYTHLVVDEAHNLERAAVQHLTLEIGGWRLRNSLRRIYATDLGGTGVLAGLERLAARAAENQEWKSPLAAGVRLTIDRLAEMNRRIEAFFRVAGEEALDRSEEAADRTPGGSPGRTKLRYRAGDGYTRVLRSSSRGLIASCASLNEALGLLQGTLQSVPDSWLEDREEKVNAVQAAADFCRETEERVSILTEAEDEARVYWVEASRGKPLSCVLTGAPLRVAERLHDGLFDRMRTVVLTSATLAVGDRFDYQVERLGLDRVPDGRLRVQGIGSPFDYEDQVMIGVPSVFPSPRSGAFQAAISRLILDLVVSTRRSTLVLFTSYSQLNRTFQDIESPLAEHGVVVMAQGTSGPRTVLLDRFRRTDAAVLLGTDSFWEGVDVPGKSLEVVVMVKLPFAVPSEPLVQAQMERLEEAGRNSFLEYQVPEAVIKFRQGFGRLIRSTRDYGVVTILDQRVISTTYGHQFLHALPARSEVFPDADALVERVAYWFKAREKRKARGIRP